MKFIVFGLGHFGASLAQKLVSLGHEVIAVDIKSELVDKFKDRITQTIELDATSRMAITVLPLKDCDAALVAIGQNEGLNVMITALLKEMGVKRLICRVTSPLQKTVLEAMNITEFANPEADSAERLAYKLDFKGVTDTFRISDEYQLLKIEAPFRCLEKTIDSLKLAEKYHVQLVTLLRKHTTRRIFGSLKDELKVMGEIPPETVLKKGDTLVIFGRNNDLEKFIEAN